MEKEMLSCIFSQPCVTMYNLIAMKWHVGNRRMRAYHGPEQEGERARRKISFKQDLESY